MTVILLAIACGVIAVLYGIVTSRQVLAASPGNETMQAIAGAIQEGAKAYLGRQYTTIAIVGIVVAALVFYFLGITSAIGFAIGAVLSGVAGYLQVQPVVLGEDIVGQCGQADDISSKYNPGKSHMEQFGG